MNKIAMYTLFLNPKGKIITDAFIFRPKQYENNTKKIATD
jgi:glycine cleavage system aminomethyltransferase T